MSDPVRHNGGIIDKYIGDAVMARSGGRRLYGGGPSTRGSPPSQPSEQLAALPDFSRAAARVDGDPTRKVPQVEVRIGIATGDDGSRQYRL